MPPVVFEPTISAGERPQTYALARAATVTGTVNCIDLAKFGPNIRLYFKQIKQSVLCSVCVCFVYSPLTGCCVHI